MPGIYTVKIINRGNHDPHGSKMLCAIIYIITRFYSLYYRMYINITKPQRRPLTQSQTNKVATTGTGQALD